MRFLLGATTPRAIFLGLALLAACTGDDPSSPAPTREDCSALRDRMVALRLESVTSDRAQHEANLRAALGSGFVDSCVEGMRPGEVLCGINAATGEELRACGQ